MRVKGQENIAGIFGVAPKTITEWQVLGFPVAVQGGPGVASEYDAPACVQWMVERELAKVRSESPKDRLARLQADRIEFDLMKDRGLFIPAAEVEPLLQGAVVSAREMLLGEQPRLASLMVGKAKPDIEELLGAAFAEFLVKMASWQPAAEDDDEDREVDE